MRYSPDETRSSRHRGVFQAGKVRAEILSRCCDPGSLRLSPGDPVRGLLDVRLRHRRYDGGADGGTILLLGLDRHDLVAGVALVHVEKGAKSDPGQLSNPGRAETAGLAARWQTDF